MSLLVDIKKMVRILEKKPETRDSYRQMIYWYFREIGYKPENLTLFEVLKLQKEGRIPDFSSIKRTRRLIQEYRKDLAGDTYEDRKELEKKAKAEIAKTLFDN